MRDKKVIFITQTALFLALLVTLQYVTSAMGQQLVTGSVVNFVLIAACLTAGYKSGLVVALVSPFLARFFGIGPQLIQIVPVIAVANVVYVTCYSAMKFGKNEKFKYIKWPLFIVLGAVLKYLVLSLGVTKVVLPLCKVPAPMVAKLTVMFGINQLITALIGGVLAAMVVPLVKRGIKR